MLLELSQNILFRVMSPAANSNMKLNNFELFFKFIPITPPIAVPNVPKNNPINVLFNKLFK